MLIALPFAPQAFLTGVSRERERERGGEDEREREKRNRRGRERDRQEKQGCFCRRFFFLAPGSPRNKNAGNKLN